MSTYVHKGLNGNASRFSTPPPLPCPTLVVEYVIILVIFSTCQSRSYAYVCEYT